MAKRAKTAQQIVRLCDDLLRIEREKLGKLIRQKEELQLDRQRTRDLMDKSDQYSPRLIELSGERLNSIERQIYQADAAINTQQKHVNDAAVRLKAAEASLKSARQHEAMEQRRSDEIDMIERFTSELVRQGSHKISGG